MKTPYTLLSSQILLSGSHILPEQTLLYLEAATEAHHLIFKRSELISQQLLHKSCSADLIQIHARDDLLMKLEMKKNRIFLFFALSGSVRFYNKYGFLISYLRQNSYYISYKKKDDYFFRCPPGEHQAFILSIPYRRFKKIAYNHPLLLQHLSPKTSDFSFLPIVPIHKEMYRSLQDIYRKPKEALLPFIKLALLTYEEQTAPRLPTLPYHIRDYLRKHYASADLSYQTLARHFQLNERKLQNDFKSEFGYPLGHYYKALRMQDAYQKIEVQNMPVAEVYHLVGYDNESPFRWSYNKYREFVKALHLPFKDPP